MKTGLIVLPWIARLCIGMLVLDIGVVIRSSRRQVPFSWRQIGVLWFVAAFNKGISKSGHGLVDAGGMR